MCSYLGSELVQKARAIRDLQTDLAELVRQPRSEEAVKAARRVLAGSGDLTAAKVLESAVCELSDPVRPLLVLDGQREWTRG